MHLLFLIFLFTSDYKFKIVFCFCDIFLCFTSKGHFVLFFLIFTLVHVLSSRLESLHYIQVRVPFKIYVCQIR
jgi:hypothetical protein